MTSVTDFIKNNQFCSSFKSTNYSITLQNKINNLIQQNTIPFYVSEESPISCNITNDKTLIKCFKQQAMPIELSNTNTYLLTCNPFNLLIPKEYHSWQIYITTPTKFLYYLANQLTTNYIEGTFDLIHHYGIDINASDIHILSDQIQPSILFRSNNNFNIKCIIDHTIKIKLSNYIKLKSKLDISSLRKPQDGAYHYSNGSSSYDIRTATLPTHHGENISLRLFNSSKQFNTIESLGFNLKKATAINEVLQKKNGLILITGPTGSGKSTTLFTMLKALQKKQKHIITLEDPIEQILPNIQQSNTNQHYSFETGFKAILRHNPDVIAIGEIRDKTTADLVLNAAYSGHLVIASLHTNSIKATLLRLYSLGCDPFLISYCLRCIISQELISTTNSKIQLNSSILTIKKPYLITDFKKELTKFIESNTLFQ